MRIILTQAEIEEAIEKLVLDQVDVPEDMRIDIDLKATRGEEGYQAFIDIVAYDAPEDGSDRSVDPRIEPVPGAETLDIAQKVLDAKKEAQLPRRRGRPAGARNRPKTEETRPEDKIQVTDQAPYDGGGDRETVVEETVEEPAQEASVAAPVAAEAVETVDETQMVGDAPDEAPAVANQDVSEDVSEDIIGDVGEEVEPNSEAALAAEAAATEPQAEPEQVAEEPEVDYTPTPETPGFESSEAEAETEVAAEPEPPVTPQPTRSLFANLHRNNP